MNSKRKCKECKEFKKHSEMIKLKIGWFCNYEHATRFAEKKVNENRKKIENAKFKKAKELQKTTNKLKKEASIYVHAYIRLRDEKLACISCGKYESELMKEINPQFGIWDAGHYKSRGAKGHLRFNVLNIHKQCKKCNGGSRFAKKEATVSADYEKNLRLKIGDKYVDFLNNSNEIVSFDREYLIRLKKVFSKRKRHLQRLRANVI